MPNGKRVSAEERKDDKGWEAAGAGSGYSSSESDCVDTLIICTPRWRFNY